MDKKLFAWLMIFSLVAIDTAPLLARGGGRGGGRGGRGGGRSFSGGGRRAGGRGGYRRGGYGRRGGRGRGYGRGYGRGWGRGWGRGYGWGGWGWGYGGYGILAGLGLGSIYWSSVYNTPYYVSLPSCATVYDASSGTYVCIKDGTTVYLRQNPSDNYYYASQNPNISFDQAAQADSSDDGYVVVE